MTAALETLQWLTTNAGQEALEYVETLPTDRLTRISTLRKLLTPEQSVGVVEQSELRRRGKAKFRNAQAMLFTPEGLEQATSEGIAVYRASRFSEGMSVVDLCSGIGGDSMALANNRRVLAVDINPLAVFCTQHNAPNAETLCADVTALDLKSLQQQGFQSALFDPSRRTDSRMGERRRVANAEAYTPPLSFLQTVRAILPNLAVKVSPTLDDASLQRYAAKVEFLSWRGECREAILWFGSCADSLPASNGIEPYIATILHPDGTASQLISQNIEAPDSTLPRSWLYEPDPAVIRAHRIPELADLLKASLLDYQIAYLTSDLEVDTPFATAYQIVETLTVDMKKVQACLRHHQGKLIAVKRRGVAVEPERVMRQVRPCGENPFVLVLSRCLGNNIALLCKPPLSQNILC